MAPLCKQAWLDHVFRNKRIACDNVIPCADLVPLRSLADELGAAGKKVHLIGGALEAGELDAKRAIDQAARLAAMR